MSIPSIYCPPLPVIQQIIPLSVQTLRSR